MGEWIGVAIALVSSCLGGMAAAIEKGIPKLRIEEAAARTQARIDSGRQTITGVNKYQIKGDKEINFLKVDNHAVREAQLAKLVRLRAERNETDVHSTPSPKAPKATPICLISLSRPPARKRRSAKSHTRSKRCSRVTKRKFAPSAASTRRKRR